ncbi:hypothetical protein OIU78_018924 [Salix suchowensis]|nr:hypothetical protein OIU78_018924 [Salix suchowensis]KAJ6315543.1 hypothetical protein OIU78_018924 [Salix suchowensis]
MEHSYLTVSTLRLSSSDYLLAVSMEEYLMDTSMNSMNRSSHCLWPQYWLWKNKVVFGALFVSSLQSFCLSRILQAIARYCTAPYYIGITS